jgi:hypothetical protein
MKEHFNTDMRLTTLVPEQGPRLLEFAVALVNMSMFGTSKWVGLTYIGWQGSEWAGGSHV